MFPDPLFLCDPQLAVVPVFVNAGAALLPAVLAGLASALALLFKPKELLQVCRKKPQVPLVVVAGGVLVFFLIRWLAAPGVAAETRGRGAGPEAGRSGTDWAKVAFEILRQEERGRLVGSMPPPAEPPKNADAGQPADGPLVYRVNYQRSRYQGGPAPTGLALLWEFRQDDAMVLSSPLVSGTFVYCATAILDPPGTYGSVFCLEAATGRKVWETPLKSSSPKVDFKGFFSSPALTADGKDLIIGQGLHVDGEAELVCLEAATGRVKWLLPTPLHIESSPAIAGDIVVAGAGAIEAGPDHKPKGDPNGRGHPGYVLGARISDGQEIWRFPVIDPESSPAIQDGVAFIGSGLNGGGVVALRIAEGLSAKARLVWKTDTPFPATGSVTLDGDLVLVGCGNGDFVFAAPNPQGTVMALDRATGKVRWSVPMPDAVLGTIAVRDGVAICPVRNGEVVALDLKSGGKERWRQRISERSPALSGPAFTGTHVYATTSDGYLSVLDAATGKVLERVYINHESKPGELALTFSSPLVSGGRVFVGSETGGLRCYAGSNAK
ncbi:MAG: PQQ-binding-like beta-propeller repeat protein [Kiritimatiellaeota bacterium]|nr:PQQ-binding-like beta-propeller repeat protein [Kiritimatiellota bacterium]